MELENTRKYRLNTLPLVRWSFFQFVLVFLILYTINQWHKYGVAAWDVDSGKC